MKRKLSLSVSLGLLLLMVSNQLCAQSQPAVWDQFEFSTKAQTWLYTIEFYRGQRVDSIQIVNLKDTSKKAYSKIIPISSYQEDAREVAIQIGAILRAGDKQIPKDSIIWNNYNRLHLERALEILRISTRPAAPVANIKNATDSNTKKSSDSALNALDKSITILDGKFDSLEKKLIPQKNGDSASKPDTTGKGSVNPAASNPSGKAPDLDNIDSASNFYFTFLNAFNFDFSGKLATSYLGRINIFAPKAFGKLWHRDLGFITGIEKINYANGVLGNDTAQVEYFTQNVVRPNDILPSPGSNPIIRAGATYQHQFNKFTFKSSNTAWSYYAEPIWKIKDLKKLPSDLDIGIYLHLYAECFLNVWSRTQTMVNIADTSLVYTPNTVNNVYANQIIKDQPAGPVVANVTIFSGYFGAGPTFFLNPFRGLKHDSSSRFFFQTTLGVAVNAPNFGALTNQDYPLYPNGTYEIATSYSNLKAFYIVKAHFIHNLSSTSQFIIGFLIRDLLPSVNPQYAAYIGLNVNLPGVLKLISGNP